jgi:hypothetical protein
MALQVMLKVLEVFCNVAQIYLVGKNLEKKHFKKLKASFDDAKLLMIINVLAAETMETRSEEN